MASTKDAAKALKEREIFCSFASAIGWTFNASQIQSRDPPEPDILFQRDDGRVAFELLSATTPEFRQPLKSAQIIYPNDLPIDQKLRKKISTNYKSESPIDLLIYWFLAMETDDQILLSTQDILWNEGLGNFNRIWYFGENGRKFLWYKNWWSELNVQA